MERFGLYINKYKSDAIEIGSQILDLLKEKGMQCFLVEEEIKDSIDVLIAVGGDGTFLSGVRLGYPKKIPVIGVNCGTLGFLAEIEPNEVEEAIEKLINNDFLIQERMMLKVITHKANGEKIEDFALNDVVLSRIPLTRILGLRICADGHETHNFAGDGVIISSPTGSTGYSMSAGGPILDTDLEALAVTPICPHSLNGRAFLVSDKKKITIHVNDEYGHNAMLSLDGKDGCEIAPNDYVEILKSNSSMKYIKLTEKNFYDILRTKIIKR